MELSDSQTWFFLWAWWFPDSRLKKKTTGMITNFCHEGINNALRGGGGRVTTWRNLDPEWPGDATPPANLSSSRCDCYAAGITLCCFFFKSIVFGSLSFYFFNRLAFILTQIPYLHPPKAWLILASSLPDSFSVQLSDNLLATDTKIAGYFN